MLEAEELQEEVMENLIVDLRIPLPSEQKFPKQEILFPSHLIAYLLSEMLARGIVDAVREFSGNVARSIQHLTMKFEDDYITCFWFSNNFEMMSLIKPLRDNLPPPITSSQTDEHSASAVLATFQNELKHVTEGLYNGWIRQLRKRLDEMIVPAVVENQSLPGYICGQDTGYWTSWSAKPQASTSFTIDQLINFLTKLDQSMTFYHLEESIRLQVLTELVRIIGVNAFNHILVRKNFCTWKRGVQIQYNVSRLEEWCTGNNILDGLQYLEQLSQACKLLTMNKNTPNDIEQIVDVCFSLNSTQIKKLLSIYYASDFDTPVCFINCSCHLSFSKWSPTKLALDRMSPCC